MKRIGHGECRDSPWPILCMFQLFQLGRISVSLQRTATSRSTVIMILAVLKR